MPDTAVGLFRTRTEADQALGKLKQAGFSADEVSVSTRHARRKSHFGLEMLAGVVVGAILGAVVGAFATGMVPGVHGLAAEGNQLGLFLFATFAGTITGGVAGALLAAAASGDSALFYEEEVESGRIMISVSGPRLAEAIAVMRAAGAMEAAPAAAPLERPRAEGG
jgi:hypothetical protein